MLDTYTTNRKNQVEIMKSSSMMFKQVTGREPAVSYMKKASARFGAGSTYSKANTKGKGGGSTYAKGPQQNPF